MVLSPAATVYAQKAAEPKQDPKVSYSELSAKIDTHLAQGDPEAILKLLEESQVKFKGTGYEKKAGDLQKNWVLAIEIFKRFIKSIAETQVSIDLKDFVGKEMTLSTRPFRQDADLRFFSIVEDHPDYGEKAFKGRGVFKEGGPTVRLKLIKKVEWSELSEAGVFKLVENRTEAIVKEDLDKAKIDDKAAPAENLKIRANLEIKLAALALCYKLPLQTKLHIDSAAKRLEESTLTKALGKDRTKEMQADIARITFNLEHLSAEIQGFQASLRDKNGPAGMRRVGDTYVDIYEYPNMPGYMPARMLTWAEAQRLCRTRQKRLCYVSEWQSACSGSKDTKWPYGNEERKNLDEATRKILAEKQKGAVPTPCNTLMYRFDKNGKLIHFQRGAKSALKPIGDSLYKDCVSSHGIHDMSGSVAEYVMINPDNEREVAEAKNRPGQVLVMGGSWFSKTSFATCKSRLWYDRIFPRHTGTPTRYATVGFRCCADVPAGVSGVRGDPEIAVDKKLEGKQISVGTGPFLSADWSSDGKWIVVTTRKGEVIVISTETWETSSLTTPSNLRTPEYWTARFTPDAKKMVVLHKDGGKINLLESGSWLGIRSSTEDKNIAPLRSAFTPDGKTMFIMSLNTVQGAASPSLSGLIRVWLVGEWQTVATIMDKLPNEIPRAIAISPDAKLLVLASDFEIIKDGKVLSEGRIHIGALAAKKIIANLTHGKNIIALAFSPDGKTLASMGGDGSVKIWSITEQKEVRLLETKIETPQKILFSPDGKHILATGKNQSVVYKTDDWKTVKRIEGWGGRAIFSPDGKRLLLTYENDNKSDFGVKIWPIILNP